jgi:hypothetical protein
MAAGAHWLSRREVRSYRTPLTCVDAIALLSVAAHHMLPSIAFDDDKRCAQVTVMP